MLPKKPHKSRFTLEQWQVKCADVAFNNVGEYLLEKGSIDRETYDEVLLASEFEMRDKFGEKPTKEAGDESRVVPRTNQKA